MRIALGLEYDGRAFHGWQRQPEAVSVQGALEDALSRIAGHSVQVICAGRTDAGVHACGQVVHFDTDALRPMSAWVRGVNAFLPSAMAVRWSLSVAEDFHARYDARARAYRYVLLNRSERPGLWAGRVGWHYLPLDVDAMRAAAGCLLGTHDFSAFRAAECQAKNPVRHLIRAEIHRAGKDLVIFDFVANAFLQHMVRNLVGALVSVGKGVWTIGQMREVLESCSRALSAPTFAPDGLYFLGPSYLPEWQIPEARETAGFMAL
ncbi:MAG: tRNA pseudouridine(38-40) synthase TruA [Zoogloeaceae bacterium]|jgi:tRNA pseudouridine38-40 synthase|nr:tRNA pseudouridine(38-40) synthase TruA [Zoogloeaceae bacterium]